jgi:Zn-dependent protease with chaperone function
MGAGDGKGDDLAAQLARLEERTTRRGRPFPLSLVSRRNVAGAAASAAAVALLGVPVLSAPAAACFVAGRHLFSRAEQAVPFTNRRHVILLPSAAEAMLGKLQHSKTLASYALQGKVLPKDHADAQLVTGIARRLIRVLGEGHGGGYQRHLRYFSWSCDVVAEPVPNAFVLPGGHVIVFTGLIALMRRDPDLLAMVMGHEIAHALGRHSAEKMGIGAAVSVATALLMRGVGVGGASGDELRRREAAILEMRRRAMMQQQQQQQQQRLAAGSSPSAAAYALPRLAGVDEAIAAALFGGGGGGGDAGREDEVRRAAALFARGRLDQAYRALGYGGGSGSGARASPPPGWPRGLPLPGARGGGGGGGLPSPVPVPAGALPGWLGERLAQTLASLLVTLPFSRRAETEADLIGVKLVALAGYDASRAPEAFRTLASASGGPRRPPVGAGGGGDGGGKGSSDLLASIGCTHPDSTRRAEVLQKELDWMSQRVGARIGSSGQGGGGGGGGGSGARHEGLESVGTQVDYWAV